ncbi:hypothetical protein BJF85_16675 [Saccharomonospora sp. CUA-673]|uniref:hypothetical protein n=1 Tax=Saccharomonospora sp. CUA-673 TaxID=1904969 RepID=UPI000968AFA8|nr:hypothetical protein [Saccharomonospora sp. CUA-673]OLT46478.1 hypothetical protein BJF85_16675 [Saccharomonospora sp. CUA-673]
MRPRTRRYALARSGDLPAEALTTRERERLVADLAALGWTVPEIAEHTHQTTYTTARILDNAKRAQYAREATA